MARLGALLLACALLGCSTLPGRSRAVATPGAGSTGSSGSAAAGEASEARIDELQRQAAMAQAEIKLLRRQLAALQVEVERLAHDDAVAPPREPAADSGFERRFDAIESSELEPVRVEPRAEDSDRPATQPPAQPRVEPRVEARVEPVVPGTSPATEAPVAGAPAVQAPGPATAAVPPAGQSIYDRGYTLYHQGRYVDSESSFQRFLQAHGDTELADNAQFWIGESRFARNDYMGALLAFQEVLDRYPGGNKVADALLKSGDCLVQLDNRESGRERYQEVLRRFPGSAAAAMAEERLNRGTS